MDVRVEMEYQYVDMTLGLGSRLEEPSRAQEARGRKESGRKAPERAP